MSSSAETAASSSLHEAVGRGECLRAARLLADGADPARRDAAGHRALDPAFAGLDVLHRIRQEYQRLPLPPYDGADDPDPTLQALSRDGIVHVPGLVPGEALRRLQSEFPRFVRRLRLTRHFRRGTPHYDERQYWQPQHRSYVSNDALAHLPSLLAVCCDSSIPALAHRYLRKTAHLKRCYAMRYLASDSMTRSQFHWHHDMEDKQMKAMVLLTDVDEEGQCMTYVRGSHRAFHPYERFLRNDLDFDYCGGYLPRIDIVKATGRAGDVYLFDSNGMHRGNRSHTSLRDALFLEFTADRNAGNLWGTDLRRASVPPRVGEDGTLAPFLAARPKWLRAKEPGGKRRGSTWSNSLTEPSSWL